jgi:virginiamycin A acetyltransferase
VRRAIKQFIISAFYVLVLPLWLIYRTELFLSKRKDTFYGYSQLLSLFPGIIGNYIRFAFYRMTLASLGDDCCISFGVTLADADIRIGSGVYIGPWCNLGLCTLEDDVLLGTDVHIMSGFAQHGYSDLLIPMREQKGEILNVRIGRDTWVGNKAVVGNHIGEKCIIGAASLVNREVPPYSIAVGNPAQVIRNRREAVAGV